MKILTCLVCLTLSAASYSQTVEIPDKNFERALIDYGIDSDNKINGKLLISDVKHVVFLDVANKNIKNLKGIEYFTSLEYLDCGNNDLSHLDLRKNNALNGVFTDLNNVFRIEKIYDVFDWFN